MNIYKVAEKYRGHLKNAQAHFPMDPIQGSSPWPIWQQFLNRMKDELLRRANQRFEKNHSDLRDHGIKLHLEENKFHPGSTPAYDLIISPFTLKEKFWSEKLKWGADELKKMTGVSVLKRTSLSGD